MSSAPIDIRDPTFDSGGVQCAASLYSPASSDRDLPCIVMGHGFNGTCGLRWPKYANRFAEAGFAVLAFD